LPSVQQIFEDGIRLGSTRLNHHANDGESISSDFPVDRVQFRTKELTVNGVSELV
jgi:hypothetical protein